MSQEIQTQRLPSPYKHPAVSERRGRRAKDFNEWLGSRVPACQRQSLGGRLQRGLNRRIKLTGGDGGGARKGFPE